MGCEGKGVSSSLRLRLLKAMADEVLQLVETLLSKELELEFNPQGTLAELMGCSAAF